MISADQLLAHAVGDYVLQSDWMAQEKTKHSVAAAVHALCYSLPFLLLTSSPGALAVIAGTHFVIDRWRLARLLVLWKNLLLRPPDSECTNYGGVSRKYDRTTGSPRGRPDFLAVWLLIIADNVMHVAINGAALRWLP